MEKGILVAVASKAFTTFSQPASCRHHSYGRRGLQSWQLAKGCRYSLQRFALTATSGHRSACTSENRRINLCARCTTKTVFSRPATDGDICLSWSETRKHFSLISSCSFCNTTCFHPGADPGKGGDWGDRPPKTNESNFIHHDFAQFGKQYSRYKGILPSTVLSQQCCEAYFISLAVVNPWWYLTKKFYWNRPPP